MPASEAGGLARRPARTGESCPRGLTTSVAACYAVDAVLMHPKQVAVTSRRAIARFLSGGVGKAHVSFTPTAVLGDSGTLRFEHGRFVDRDPAGAELARAPTP